MSGKLCARCGAVFPPDSENSVFCNTCTVAEEIRKIERRNHERPDRLASLESRLERLECENGILKRALGWQVSSSGYVLLDDRELVMELGSTKITDKEREILEKKP